MHVYKRNKRISIVVILWCWELIMKEEWNMKSQHYKYMKRYHYMRKLVHYTRREKHPAARYIISLPEDWHE